MVRKQKGGGTIVPPSNRGERRIFFVRVDKKETRRDTTFLKTAKRRRGRHGVPKTAYAPRQIRTDATYAQKYSLQRKGQGHMGTGAEKAGGTPTADAKLSHKRELGNPDIRKSRERGTWAK